MAVSLVRWKTKFFLLHNTTHTTTTLLELVDGCKVLGGELVESSWEIGPLWIGPEVDNFEDPLCALSVVSPVIPGHFDGSLSGYCPYCEIACGCRQQ